MSFSAACTYVVVSVILVNSLCVFLSMCMFVFCLSVLMNCLLNAFVICVRKVNVFSLKCIMLFLGYNVFYWLIRVWSSEEYVSCVCDHQSTSRCSLYMPDVCVCMMDVI